MKLSKIMNDIALRRHWVAQENLDFDIGLAIMFASAVAVASAITYAEIQKKHDLNIPSIEQKLSNGAAPAYRSPSQE